MPQNKIKTIQITPASASLEVLLKNRFKIMESKGFEVIGFSTNDEFGKKFTNSGFDFKSSKYLSRKFNILNDIKFFWENYKLFKEEKPTIVNTYGPKPGLYSRIAAKLSKVPIVIHTSWGFFFTDDSPWYKKFFVISLEKFSALFCDYIFSVNKDDLELMKKYKFKEPKSLGYLGNGTDFRIKFNPAKYNKTFVEKIKLELGFNPNAIIVGMVGRLTRDKGYREFFKAAKWIKNKYKDDVKFIVVGRYDFTKGNSITEDEIKQLEKEWIIEYLGYRTHDEMPKIYAIMDVVVLPSYREGFPRCLVEAAAMAKPIIATNIRGCREVVENGVNGYLVPIKNSKVLITAIEKFILDSQMRKRMGNNSRNKALKEFDENKLVNNIVNIYNKLLEEKGL